MAVTFLEASCLWVARQFVLLSVWAGAVALAQTVDVGLGSGTGFCLDQVPDELWGSRFTAPSTLSQTACSAGSHRWCPLNNRIAQWSNSTHSSLYYFFSACCYGRQSEKLIADSTGLPTCRSDLPSASCMRHHWRDRVFSDFVTDADAHYNFRSAPGTAVLNPLSHGGVTPTCICAPTDPACQNQSADGSSCLLCATDLPCGQDAVSLSIHFFKIHSLDLKTSEFFFSGWIRQSWHEPRIVFDYQCYGGQEYVEAMGDPGSLENTEIWTPDIELYNSESNIWQGSIAGRLAAIYSANGPHSRGGSVFFSRPGLVRALCKFQGVLMFPYDTLACELEFAPFLLDGRYQDVVGGAATWVDSPDSTSLAGITAGSSFQDYGIMDISSRRWVAFYACCPNSPYPEIIYTVRFKRSASYYVLRLIIPTVILAVMGFLSFWMDPQIGERLGFCMVVILAIVTNDMVSMEMVPVSEERVLLDHFTNHCKLFSIYSLIETGIVLYLYHLKVDSWKEALVPSWALFLMSPSEWCATCRKGKETSSGKKPARSSLSKRETTMEHASKERIRRSHLENLETEAVIRRQLWLRAFYTIDEDFSGTLTTEELSEFIDLMMQSSKSATSTIISLHDLDGSDSLNEEEFLLMCESQLVKGRTYEELERVVSGFLQSQDRKDAAMIDLWRTRALNVDRFARVTFPPGFLIAMVSVFHLTEDDLKNFEASPLPYAWFFLSEFIPLILGLMCIGLSTIYEKWRASKFKPAEESATAYVHDDPNSHFQDALDAKRIELEKQPVSSRAIGRTWSFTPSNGSDIRQSDATTAGRRYHDQGNRNEHVQMHAQAAAQGYHDPTTQRGQLTIVAGTRVEPGGLDSYKQPVYQSPPQMPQMSQVPAASQNAQSLQQQVPFLQESQVESIEGDGSQKQAANRIRAHLAKERGTRQVPQSAPGNSQLSSDQLLATTHQVNLQIQQQQAQPYS